MSKSNESEDEYQTTAESLALMLGSIDEGVAAKFAAFEKRVLASGTRTAAETQMASPSMASTPIPRAIQKKEAALWDARKRMTKLLEEGVTAIIAVKQLEDESRHLAVALDRHYEEQHLIAASSGLYEGARKFTTKMFVHGVGKHQLNQQSDQEAAILSDLIVWKSEDPRFADHDSPWPEVLQIYANRSLRRPAHRYGNSDDKHLSRPGAPVDHVGSASGDAYYRFPNILASAPAASPSALPSATSQPLTAVAPPEVATSLEPPVAPHPIIDGMTPAAAPLPAGATIPVGISTGVTTAAPTSAPKPVTATTSEAPLTSLAAPAAVATSVPAVVRSPGAATTLVAVSTPEATATTPDAPLASPTAPAAGPAPLANPGLDAASGPAARTRITPISAPAELINLYMPLAEILAEKPPKDIWTAIGLPFKVHDPEVLLSAAEAALGRWANYPHLEGFVKAARGGHPYLFLQELFERERERIAIRLAEDLLFRDDMRKAGYTVPSPSEVAW